jgi:hypothetical protein
MGSSFLDSCDGTCLIFFLAQPSDLDGAGEILQDVLQPKWDVDSLVVDLLELSGEPSRHQHYARGCRWLGGQSLCCLE